MAFKLKISARALDELSEALEHYETISPQLKIRFAEEFYARLDAVAANPEVFPLVKRRPDYRKARLKKFPYWIVYRFSITRAAVSVVTLVHGRRDPAYLLSRLKR